jgi:transposase
VKTYTDRFKRAMVQRMLLPNGPTATSLAEEVGVPQPTLSRWVRTLGTLPVVSNHNAKVAASGSRRPEDWSAQERLRAVLEASQLSAADLGEFLRREGLHEETLQEWRTTALDALAPSSPRSRGGDKKRIKRLERELVRKDKALAETAALLVLQKKVRDLWGDGDESTNEDNDK